MKWAIIVSAAVLLVGVTAAKAAYIVYDFSGTFEHQEFAGPVVPNGSSFDVRVSFDESGNRIDEPFSGGVISYYSPVYVEISVGSERVWANAAQVQVRDSTTIFDDQLLVRAGAEANAPFSGTLNGNAVRFFALRLSGFPDAISSSDYPRSPTLSDFRDGRVGLLAGPVSSQALSSNSYFGIIGDETYDEFRLTAARVCDTPNCQIPEPRALALAACGFAALIVARSSRRARLSRNR